MFARWRNNQETDVVGRGSKGVTGMRGEVTSEAEKMAGQEAEPSWREQSARGRMAKTGSGGWR